MAIKSSITDQAIISREEESLDTDKYVHALNAFIKSSATPLTVGIQGEWGSGKTSMMNLIRLDMHESDVATAWVNTWEYSMFREPEQIAPAVMHGLIESLQEFCVSNGNWPSELTNKVEKVKGFLKNVGKFALDVGVQTVTGKDGFSDTVSGSSEKNDKAEIAKVKKDICNIVDILVKNESNPYKMVVFFIDDLDRIDPAVAVNVLEAMKNLFDIPECVFVLAIDYDVVVKGLESKFGVKTQENEREFRSFFDKLIQVPFSMPVSSYNIDKLLASRFEQIGFTIASGLEDSFRDIVNYTVGCNPRSIKRYINTFSLLRTISQLAEDQDDNKMETGLNDFMLFAFVGIQISYPRIYQLILKEPDFVSWNEAFAESINLTVSIPEHLAKNDLYDEEWEQIIWSFCQKDLYLKVRSNAILNALNIIRKKVGDNDLNDAIESTLQMTNITSVDDDDESFHKKHQRIRYDGWESYCKSLIEKGFGSDSIELITQARTQLDAMCEDENLKIKMNYAPSEFGFSLDVPIKNKTKFIAIFPRKRGGFSYWTPTVKGSKKIQTIEGVDSEFWDVIHDSIKEIQDRVSSLA